MRLIDADYVTEKLNEINGTSELDKAFEVVENASTVDVLDKILDEIWDIDDEIVLNPNSLECKRYVRVIKVIDIIDKYKEDT